jgi:putative ABC transport system permease protein
MVDLRRRRGQAAQRPEFSTCCKCVNSRSTNSRLSSPQPTRARRSACRGNRRRLPGYAAALPAQQQRTQTTFTYVMVAIAAISLLVGGIGIMNIVLATVMERTREIGIRRSIGARRFDIVRQFLTESVLISVGGGLLGIAFGFFLAWLIARTAEWKTIVTTASVVIAFGVSVFVGVVFGIYPAVKASRINPIDALRYE